LITHTSLLKRYGVQTLIKAVPLLKKEIPQLEIKVLGAGEYRPQLEELSQSLGAMDCVHFAGYVSVEEMLSCIAKAHIGIMSLLPQKQPQMPNKLFDYLAIGTPVVATSLPAIIPYLNENSVMYYKPDDENDLARCILELYRNPGKRAALAASGSTDYQKYRWSVMKYEYLKVYEQMVNGQKQALSGKNLGIPG
jgi:glycosyltransferase involved in cell wall biosynthesis